MAEAPHGTPPGATDTHLHVYGPGCGSLTAAAGTASAGTLAEYRAEMVRLGLARAVLIQPVAYGTNNTCMLAALAALGPAARGVAVVPEDVGDRDLDLLGAQGVAGLRCFLLGVAGTTNWDRAARLAPRIAERGWHVDLQLDATELPEREISIHRLPGSLVIDHMGRLPSPPDPGGPEMAALLRLMDTGRVWIKLSAPYYSSRSGPSRYEDTVPVARRLVSHAPDRCLWASNWPYPKQEPRPDTLELFHLLDVWAPDEKTRRRILVDNPAALYGFPPP
jgi:D-galactarolactone isomerase